MTDRPVYLDNHATTQVDPRVVDVMLPLFATHYGNAASTSHDMGLDASDVVETAREKIGLAIGAGLREIVFTSGATEANNIAIKGVLRSRGKDSHLIVNAAEHKAVLDPASRLRREGFGVTVLPVDEHACIDAESIASAIRPETVLVSVMLVNNEVGSINSVREITDVCGERGVLVHCDASQAFGKMPLDVRDLGVDLLSLSAHKAYGPKGVGILFVKESEPAIRIEPLVHGGGHENGLRSGTLPVPLIAGFGAAARLAVDELEEETARIRKLRDKLWQGLKNACPDLILNGHPECRAAGNLNVSVPNVDGDVLITEIEDIAVSAGSACTTAEPEPSHVLRAIGRSSELARASIRFGVGRFNTADDIRTAIRATVSAIERARSQV